MATLKATVRRNSQPVIGKGEGGQLIVPGVRTIEVSACASGTIIDFGLRIPADARIDPSSRIYFDDLATSGSPVLNVGLYPVDGNTTTTLTTALASSLAISSASAALGIIIPADYQNAGKKAWDLLGLTSGPGGFLDVKGVVKTAAINGAGLPGTITLDLKYYLD